jgi:cytochrome c oxidase assembly protein subunit 15
MLLVLMASAALRLGHAGCADAVLPESTVIVARTVHRIAATLVGMLVVAIAWLMLRRGPVLRGSILQLCGLSAVTIFLAVLGRASAGSMMPLVTIGNVVSGVVLYVLFHHMRLQFTPHALFHSYIPGLRRPAAMVRSLAGLQIWLGAWAAGLAAGFGCVDVTGTMPWWSWPHVPSLAALNPMHVPNGAASVNALRWMQLVHEASAIAVLLLAVPLALRMRRLDSHIRGDGNRLLLVLGAQATLGIATVFTNAMPWSGVAHNALAAVLLGLLVQIHARFRRQ